MHQAATRVGDPRNAIVVQRNIIFENSSNIPRSAAGIIANVVSFAVCLPLMRRFRHVKMPLITRRWYDIPLRASLVATLRHLVLSKD